MKKLAVLFSVLALCGCPNMVGKNIGSFRNAPFEYFSTYSISFYDDEDDKLVNSEYITEDSFKNNVILTAYTGYTVVDTKTYRKDTFRNEILTPNKSGVLNTGSVPVGFKKGQRIKALGQVTIDGVDYVLVETEMKGYVALVKQDGSFYNRVGQIRNGRLALIDADFIPYPADLRLIQVTSSKTTQTEPVKGFDIKYEGVKLDRMQFTILDYSTAQGGKGRFENISFPNKPGIININGIGIKVLDADKQRIDYILLK